MQVEEFLERQLLNVSKPSWYTGGEFGSVEKDKNKVDIRYAFCFRTYMMSACPIWESKFYMHS